jgi:hypothetical protein
MAPAKSAERPLRRRGRPEKEPDLGWSWGDFIVRWVLEVEVVQLRVVTGENLARPVLNALAESSNSYKVSIKSFELFREFFVAKLP